MSRYDDPRWYEEQDTVPPKPTTSNNNGSSSYDIDNVHDDDVYPHRQRKQSEPPAPRQQSRRILGPFLAVKGLGYCWFF